MRCARGPCGPREWFAHSASLTVLQLVPNVTTDSRDHDDGAGGHRGSGPQRGAGSRSEHQEAGRLSAGGVPVYGAGDHRRQRQHGCHLGDCRRAGPRAGPGPRGTPGPARTRPGAARHLVAERGRRPRVHGCRPVDGPERAASAGGAAAVRAQRRGHRHPARPGIAGDPRAQARDHLPLLQPAAARAHGRAVLRRPVRLQGDRARAGAGSAAADPGHRLVLRHRAARAGRARRAAHPRGPGRLDRRPGLAGRHRRHRAGRPARHGPARPPPGHGVDQGPPAARTSVPPRLPNTPRTRPPNTPRKGIC